MQPILDSLRAFYEALFVHSGAGIDAAIWIVGGAAIVAINVAQRDQRRADRAGCADLEAYRHNPRTGTWESEDL